MAVDVGLPRRFAEIPPPSIEPIELTNDFICECGLSFVGGNVELAGGVDRLHGGEVVWEGLGRGAKRAYSPENERDTESFYSKPRL